MIDHSRAIDGLRQALAALGQPAGTSGDAIEQLAHRDLLLSDDAGFVGGRDASTVAKWAQGADDEGDPFSIKVGTSRLYVTRRLLDYIERRFGLYARREAETRHRILVEMRVGAQNSTQSASRRAVAAPEPCENGDEIKIAIDPEPIGPSRAAGME